MKSRKSEDRAGDSLSGNAQVRREIQSFVQALNTYPERFLKDPGISFEEHCSGLNQTGRMALKTAPRRRRA
ncbi:MAG TPA: hypothetical protein VGM18_07070 [Candidatus Sulfotelmatobacter sp.]